ncbi:MAG: thioredoxin family protein [Planctomycetaceae bacterium]|nr:thioredoxin family protein [Planctomycetaceae bacterium]
MPRFLEKNLFISLLLLLFIAIGCGTGGNSASPAANKSIPSEIVSPIEFIENRTEGLEIAKKEKKPVLLFFTIPNNVCSQKMLETAFGDAEVKQLAKSFVCIKIDGVEAADYCETLGVRGFPTVVLAHSSGGEIQRLTGKQSPDQLAVQMHAVLQTMAMRQSGTVH